MLRVLCSLKAMAVSAPAGESRCAPSGVLAYGTLEEDGPATWETLALPCGRFDRVGHRPGTTGAAADGSEGVGGPHTSADVGERVAPGPGRAKAARVDVSFRRDP